MKKIMTFTVFFIVFTVWLIAFQKDARPAEMFGPIITEGVVQAEAPINSYHKGKLCNKKFLYWPILVNPTNKDYKLIFWCEAKDKNGKVLDRCEFPEDGEIVLHAREKKIFKSEFYFSEGSETVRYERGVIAIPIDNSI